MKKHIISLILFALFSNNFISAQVDMDNIMSNIYPYIVTVDYPIDILSGKSTPIGNQLFIEYVLNKNGLVESFDISKQNNIDKLKLRALQNLQFAFKREIKAMSFTHGPNNCSFILLGNHWSASTQILNPSLLSWSSNILKTNKVIISIPNRDTLLIFPYMDSKYFKEIEEFVISKEADENKMLTFKLFELSKSGLKPIVNN